jgi:2-polyprenyl-3-methyl-5-hydroxy-6-metoxy-1,4-benzoquinol methylase
MQEQVFPGELKTMSDGCAEYDVLGADFRTLSEQRAFYLSAIDRIVINQIPDGSSSMLDVGAGDGVRAARIRSEQGIKRLVLAEPSRTMAELCRKLPSTEVWPLAAQDLPDSTDKFDVITCLWNVLGHLESHKTRQAALRKMSHMLSPNGLIFVDVNNRYNARSYGLLKSGFRFLYDLILPSEANGDVSFIWHVSERSIQASGHVFRPAEIETLLKEAGLRILERFVIDDKTGKLRRFKCEGQLLYVATVRR